MGGISNTLRQRLAARPAPQVHPEADMLAAYVEQALPAAERDQIVLHLADCAECREVAALSLPMQPDTQAAHHLPAGRSLWWIGLRWASLAATIVIVAVLAIKQPWRGRDAGTFSSSKSPSPAGEPKVQPLSSATAASPDQPPAVVADNAGATKTLVASSNPVPSARREVSALETKQSYINTARFQTADQDPERDADDARAVPPPPSPQPGTGPNLKSVFAAGNLNRGSLQPDLLAGLDKTSDPGAGLRSGTTPSASKSNFVSRYLPFKMAKKIIRPVLTAGGLSGSTMGEPGSFSLSATRIDSTTSASLARPGAALEKDKVAASADAGPVALKEKESAAFTERARAPAPATAPATGGNNYSYDVGQVQWKVADGKLLKSAASFDWQEGYPLHNVTFTAVAPRGNEVWAGGANAALVHSRNGGVAWEKVNISDTASGDVTRITLEGAKITVKTSTQQTWSSQDGGRSWTLQTAQN